MKDMNKHTKLRIESWCKKFCQITSNIVWKKNRNLHAICLLDMILNQNFEEPYNKFPPEGPLPFLSQAIVKSKLSDKIFNYSNNAQKNGKNFGMKKSKSYDVLKRNNLENEINKCNDIELLKRLVDKLNNKVEETNKIIKEQNEENNILNQKVTQLEKLLKSYKI